jgi:hypothetical protein
MPGQIAGLNMTPTQQPDMPAPSPQQEFNIERINRLIADLEQELAKAPGDTPRLLELREEIDTLKNVLKSSQTRHDGVDAGLHSTRSALQKFTQTVEGEVLRDSPVIAEMGRILGLV